MSLPTTLSSQPQLSTQSPHHALELTDILEEILGHVETPQELLEYRSVSQKWNDAIIHTLNTKWKNYFPLRVRYGSEVPLSLLQSEAERAAREVLESPEIMTLTGSNGSTTPLSFDTVIVDREFYLAGVNPEWQHFLEIYGESIRHMKFDIRGSGKVPEENSHHVPDCAQLVSRENLRAAFSAVSNLESLDFSIRFTQYGTEERALVSQRMFPEAHEVTDLPQLLRLTKITIQQPHGIKYVRGFLKEILGMAPNLTTLNIKWSEYLSAFADVLRALPHLDNSITTLGISMTDRNTRFNDYFLHEFNFSRFHLTKLELNCISGTGSYLEEFLQSQSSTLTTLILGDRSTPKREPRSFDNIPGFNPRIGRHSCIPCYRQPLSFPPIMPCLKILDLNLFKYNVASLTKYQNRFPSLEELTFSNCEDPDCFWEYQRLLHLLPGEPTQTVKKFSLLGQMRVSDRHTIVEAIHFTFPVAEYHFGL